MRAHFHDVIFLLQPILGLTNRCITLYLVSCTQHLTSWSWPPKTKSEPQRQTWALLCLEDRRNRATAEDRAIQPVAHTLAHDGRTVASQLCKSLKDDLLQPSICVGKSHGKAAGEGSDKALQFAAVHVLVSCL